MDQGIFFTIVTQEYKIPSGQITPHAQRNASCPTNTLNTRLTVVSGSTDKAKPFVIFFSETKPGKFDDKSKHEVTSLRNITK